jgi:hypothetical protein
VSRGYVVLNIGALSSELLITVLYFNLEGNAGRRWSESHSCQNFTGAERCVAGAERCVAFAQHYSSKQFCLKAVATRAWTQHPVIPYPKKCHPVPSCIPTENLWVLGWVWDERLSIMCVCVQAPVYSSRVVWLEGIQ